MAKRIRDRREEDDPEGDPEYEGFVRGTVKRLLETGVAAPTAARTYIVETFASWKTEFLGVFQSELRRYLDRLSPSEEMKKLLEGKRVEFRISARLVDDERPRKSRGKAASRREQAAPRREQE